MRNSSIVTFVVFLTTSCWCYAQDSPDLWLQPGLGINAYKGDLSGYDKYTSSFSIGILLNKKKNFNGNLKVGAGVLNGENRNFTFHSDQRPLPVPNRFVKTSFFYLNYDLHYNIVKKQNVIVYVSQGIGLMRFNPKNDLDQHLLSQPTTREDGELYRKEALILPTNVGAIYLLANQFGLSAQAGFYNTITDYLDNISNLGDDKNDNILTFQFSFLVPLN